MPRTPVTTRLATADDVPVLAALWEELRQVGGRAERAINPVAIPDIAARLEQVVAGERCHVVVATADGEPAGMAIFRAIRPDPLSDSLVLQMSHLVVATGMRRRGVGRALLAAAVELADEMHLEHVGVGIYPSLRDASRFYARLGFAPMLLQRVAPIAVLRRRIGVPDSALPRIDDLVRRRRGRRTVPPQRRAGRSTAPVD